MRFGLRTKLALMFTVALTAVFAGAFWWFYTFTTDRATERLRAGLDAALNGGIALIDADELVALARDGQPNAAGYSDDPRYQRELAALERIHQLQPNAYPYTLIRGDAADTRRLGARKPSPELIYVVDDEALHDRSKAARYLASATASEWEVAAYQSGGVSDRPGTYRDEYGEWMTSSAALHDRAGHVVGLLGVDYEASYVDEIQSEIRTHLEVMFVVTYLIGLVLVYAAATLFTRPLTRLTRATDALREDSLGTELDVGPRRDEIGALARAFNRMSVRLARAFQHVEAANAELEQRVDERTAQLTLEQAKAERLLHNVLPREIAERLKNDQTSIAEGFDAVTVLFADIVGFTELSARSSPIEVVTLLNEVFSAFDRLADEHGLEKIKTIGDAYMVVGGLPLPRADHVAAIARMALDMQAFMAALAETPARTGLAIRIGVHTGPVVAGVLGTKKFSYDLWGDTVNIASRMESHGERGRVQISEDVAKALDDSEFIVTERGTTKLKGRGELRTFWLVARA